MARCNLDVVNHSSARALCQVMYANMGLPYPPRTMAAAMCTIVNLLQRCGSGRATANRSFRWPPGRTRSGE